ncbi:MAG: ABC transporter permease [Lachnoclostridium sp.]|jgi:ABC-type dipeptide/oligopeptide/nickel transport system permease component|nr:ABC transporter permease [Lachnoclostridium sp.]
MVKRIGTLIITILLLSIIIFVAFSVLPGDASLSKLGTDASPERIEKLREEMGLHDPLPVRYLNWMKNAVHLDFGQSLQYTDVPVKDLIGQRFGVTMILTCLSFLLILFISYPLGVFCGRKQIKIKCLLWLRLVVDFLVRITMAIPPFFLGILITYLFGITFRWFRPGDYVSPSEDFAACIWYLLFPAIAIALPKSAMIIRFLSEAVKQESTKEYVRTAYSKGCSENRVFYGHILKNALIPTITFSALVLIDVIAGSLVIEQVFNVPGIGRLLVTAISNRDFPVVQGTVLLLAGFVVIANSAVDLMYRRLDPRTRVNTAKRKG